MELPLLGMGTWGMGGKYERDESNIDESLSILRYGLELGIELIDVAEIYGGGLTEEIVGKAIQDFPRADILLVSKVWRTNLQYNDVLRACEQSLNRLQTDYLDLYLIHWPSDDVPLSETLEAMEHLWLKGLVRNIGVSNFSINLLQQAQCLLQSTNLAVNQIEYNLLQRQAEQHVIPYCKKNNIRIMAHRPLAKGSIPFSQLKSVIELSKKYHKTPAQIALNWIMSQNIIAIPKTAIRQHMLENVGALGWKLEKGDLEILSKEM